MDSRQSRAQGRKVEEEKYVLQNQRNTFTESEKYIYRIREIHLQNQKNTGASLEGGGRVGFKAGKLRSRKIGEMCCTESEKYGFRI